MIFDHIGLFVRDIEAGRRQLSALLPIERWTEAVDDPLMKVRVQFGVDGSGIRYELVAPFGEPNPVARVLDEGKTVLNHVAYRCADFESSCAMLRREGAMPLGRPQPASAFGGARVAFYLTPLRFIVELVEDRTGGATR
ncbi:MAG TPA: VOC family protein [Stellaceae bacterium]|nr:VOC family protein [Stellaceae bacterium]